MWELLHTEVSYIRKLRVITNVSVGPWGHVASHMHESVNPQLSWSFTWLAVFESRKVRLGIPSNAWEGALVCWPGEAGLTQVRPRLFKGCF